MLNAPEKFLREALSYAHAATEACFYVVPDRQPSFYRGENFAIDNVGRYSQQNGLLYNVPAGVVFTAQFMNSVDESGYVGCGEFAPQSEWPRVMWVSSAPAGQPVLPLTAGLRPMVDVRALAPGAAFWLNCLTPYRDRVVHYYGRRR